MAKKSFKKLIFLCDAGLTCNRLIDFLLDRDITFVCAVSQNRVDEYSGMKLRQISLDVPSVVKLKGIDKELYAYRIGEGTDKERVVISNKGLSRRRFEGYYRRRWAVEIQIKRLKSMGLEDYRVRKAVAIDRCVMGVWHVELERIRAMLSGVRLGEWLRARHMPEVYWRLLCMLEVIEGVVSVLWRYAPFPDDKLVFFWLSKFIKGDSHYAKL